MTRKTCRVFQKKNVAALRNQRLGFVYQFHHLVARIYGTGKCGDAGTGERHTSSPGSQQSQSTVLEKVGMIRRLDHKPSELSGGERQRAAIARAVINEPRCICADEPTGNLDKATAEQVVQVLMRLNNEYGTSLIVVTHDMELAKKMDTIYTIENGELKKV